MKKTHNKGLIIAVITIAILLMSLWLFENRASEKKEDSAGIVQIVDNVGYYQPYRDNILGVAGDFAVFSKEDTILTEVTADVAVGGDLSATSFGNYEKNWKFYKDNDFRYVNLNSYIRGTIKKGDYKWKAKKTEEQLTTSSGTKKGTWNDGDKYAKGNIYVYTGENANAINEIKQSNAYNIYGINYEYINFEEEFNNLREISKKLINANDLESVNCTPEKNKTTYIYNFPEDKNVVIINVDPKKFFDNNNCKIFNITGLNEDKKIIVNIDCNKYLGSKMPKIQINGSSVDWNDLAENVIFNLYVSEPKQGYIVAQGVIGTILAPNISVYVNKNLNGSVIAQKVIANKTIYGINSDIGWGDLNGLVDMNNVSDNETVVDNANQDNTSSTN